jgi:hypothetical protein
VSVAKSAAEPSAGVRRVRAEAVQPSATAPAEAWVAPSVSGVLLDEPAAALPEAPAWDPERTKQMVPQGSEWKYLDSGSDAGAAWKEPGYDDGAWKAGAAPLGYGDEGIATEIGFGDDKSQKHITTYFRRTFEVDDPAELSEVRIRLRRDDGAAVYLNGKEVARDNLPPAAGAADLAPDIVGGAAEGHLFAHPVQPGILTKGKNTIAVEVHQSAPSSSDLVFELILEGLKN